MRVLACVYVRVCVFIGSVRACSGEVVHPDVGI